MEEQVDTQRTRKGIFLRSNKGQTALVMILILAVAFIFYAITLNWSRIAALKTTTWMAAVSGSSQAASNFASYGERVIQEQMVHLGGLSYNGGNLKYCKKSNFLLALFFVVLAVIATILTGQGWVIALAVGVLLTATVLIKEFVLEPMAMSMWNKLYSNLKPVDQFRESALSTGMQQIIGDTVKVPDRFDLDGNGLWGFTGNAINDKIGRYSLYYTERLKSIKPQDASALEAFRQALDNLIKQPTPDNFTSVPTTSPGLGFTSYCNSTNATLPQCNPICTGVGDRPYATRQNNNIGWQYPPPDTMIPYVPGACQAACTNPLTCPPFEPGREFSLIYDPSLEGAPVDANPANIKNSFRYRFGHDDEIGKSLFATPGPVPGSTEPAYNSSSTHVKGVVFPFLNGMTQIDDTLFTFHTLNGWVLPSGVTNELAGLSQKAKDNSSLRKKVINTLPKINNYRAQDNDCAQTKDSANGFFWKKGSDQYCASLESSYPNDMNDLLAQNVVFSPSASSPPNYHFPYYQCAYMFDASGEGIACPAGTTGAQLWPQDQLDDMNRQLSQLIKTNDEIQNLDKDSLSASVETWYLRAAEFIAPRCNTDYTYSTPLDNFVTNNLPQLLPFAGNAAVCNPDEHGHMIKWLYDLTNWEKLLNDPLTGWLTQSYGTEATDLCYGTPSAIAECLDINHNSKWKPELDACTIPDTTQIFVPTPPPGHNETVYPPLSQACVFIISKGVDSTTHTQFFTDLTTQIDPITGQVVPIPAPTEAQLAGRAQYIPTAATYQIIKDWVNDNKIMKSYVYDSSVKISKLVSDANGVATLAREGKDRFQSFLMAGGPAETLMKAVRDLSVSSRRLPSFIIYGWKDDKKTLREGDTNNGLWHLARVEVREPHHLPYPRAYKSGGFFNRKSCVEYTGGNDDVWMRATRWDEDFARGASLFANGLPIWQFKFGNPRTQHQTFTTADIEANCIKNGMGIGLTTDTLEALHTSLPNNPAVSSVSDEGRNLKRAFMINIDPRSAIPMDQTVVGACPAFNLNDCGTEANYLACCTATSMGAHQYGYYGSANWISYCQKTNLNRCINNRNNAQLRVKIAEIAQCFSVASDLLSTGVQSQAGAHYGVPNSQPWHSGIFFHSSQATKDKRINGQPVFTEDTFNDVETPIN